MTYTLLGRSYAGQKARLRFDAFLVLYMKFKNNKRNTRPITSSRVRKKYTEKGSTEVLYTSRTRLNITAGMRGSPTIEIRC